VTGLFASVVIVASLLMAGWSVILLLINRPPGRLLLIGAGALEVLLLVLAIGGIVQMAASDRDFARLEFVGYLAACVAIVPAAVWWIRDEKSRAAAGVLTVVFLVVPVLVVRVQQVWAGPGA